MLSRPISALTESGVPLRQRRIAIMVGTLLVAHLAGGADVAFKFTDQKNQPVADAVVSLIPLDAPARSVPNTDNALIARIS